MGLRSKHAVVLGFAALWSATTGAAPAGSDAVVLDPAKLQRAGEVDPGYQSYNVETVEVIGGRFWAPYPDANAPKPGANSPGSMGAAMFRKREPIDLTDKRLRNLARALGPAYVRVSGAWANSTYFQDDDKPALAEPPKGYQGVLTRAQWAGVIDFVRATGWKLVISFPVSAGARNPDGKWNPDQARRLLRFTRSLGGEIYAAELVNEPNIGSLVGLPQNYNSARFAEDVAALRAVAATEAPRMKIVGPGSTGEAGFTLFPSTKGQMATSDLLGAAPKPTFDIFSYHFYGTVSKRCSAMDKSAGIQPGQALTEAWLSRADTVFDFYAKLQSQFVANKPIWVTEIAQAACGGDAWAATFLDTFRYVDQLGRLAKRGLDVHFHNTLAASDYALIDEDKFEPRPSYWAALLWSRLMAPVVLDAGPQRGDLHLYSHCLKGRRGGVAIVAINLNTTVEQALELPRSATLYRLTAPKLEGDTVDLNGTRLETNQANEVPTLKGSPVAAGRIALAPSSISFLAIAGAGNAACTGR